MAEQIEITNVGGDKSIASESTLRALVKAMEKLDPSGASSKKVREYNESLKNGAKASRKNAEALEKNTTATSDANQATKKFAQSLRDAAFGAIGALTGSIGGLGKEIISGGTKLGDFTKHIPLIGSAISPLVGIIDDSIDSFRELSSVGASFNNSITDMRLGAARAELTLSEFGSLVTSNSETLRVLGSTVNQGVRRFNAINKELKDTGDFEFLKTMGFTVQEINEGLVDYIDLQTLLGRNQRRDATSLAKGSSDYLKQLDALAKITGKSRKEMADAMQRQASDAGFRALANQFEEGSIQAKNFAASMALIDTLPADVASGLKDLADGVAQTPEAIALINAAGPEIAVAMEKVADGADPQVILDALGQAGVDIEKFAGLEGKQRAAFIQKLRDANPTLASILDAATQMQKMGTDNYKEALEEQKKRDAITNTLATFDDNIRTIRASITKTLIDSGLFENLSGILANFSKAIEQAVPHIVKWLEEFAELAAGQGGFGAAIKEKILNPIKDSIVSGLTSLWEDNKIIGSIVAGLGALFVGSKITSALAGAIRGLFGGGTGLGSAGKGASAKSSTLGKGTTGGASGVSKFLGNATKGALSGTAAGLIAFANPKVPVGAAALGASITAIGAGIAGAAWIMGKALPTFASGMKSFEDLDGDKLSKSGDGLLAIGTGFAAFGAGGVAAGIGGIITGISDGLVSLFSGDDPLTKLKKFADFEVDSIKVKANAEAMIAFGNAMQSNSPVTGLSNLISGISDGLVSLFSGDDPLTKLQKFAAADIDSVKLKANAEAMIAFGNAMQAGISSMSKDSSGLMDVFTGFFDDDPAELLVDFGEAKINTENVIKNANALISFSTAMKSTSSIPDSATNIAKSLDSFFENNTVTKIKKFADADFNEAKLAEKTRALLNLNHSFSNGFTNLTSVNSDLEQTLLSIQRIEEISSLDTNLSILNSLDKDGIKNYNQELIKMVELLEKMNETLAETNNKLLTVDAKMEPSNNASSVTQSKDNSDLMNRLNSSLNMMNTTLMEIKQISRKQLGATENLGNVY